MVLCARDMSAGVELMQDELFSGDEPECPGYDVCPVAMRVSLVGIGCRGETGKIFPIQLYMGMMAAYY